MNTSLIAFTNCITGIIIVQISIAAYLSSLKHDDNPRGATIWAHGTRNPEAHVSLSLAAYWGHQSEWAL